MKIEKHNLFLYAGLLWLFAGIMVLSTGIPAWQSYHTLTISLTAIIIFFIFYKFIFSKLVKKHEIRIITHPDNRLAWWKFFDKKSYIIMIVMISIGITLKISKILPIKFFAYFYLGLGFALFVCGIKFTTLYFKYHPKQNIK